MGDSYIHRWKVQNLTWSRSNISSFLFTEYVINSNKSSFFSSSLWCCPCYDHYNPCLRIYSEKFKKDICTLWTKNKRVSNCTTNTKFPGSMYGDITELEIILVPKVTWACSSIRWLKNYRNLYWMQYINFWIRCTLWFDARSRIIEHNLFFSYF